ncbi:hypothetical protein FRC12_023384 [Ceratobasidium sp. 428]|nr:hypothetical protein FRC12_023384 [Ceratobasidium sp. 428]
MRLGTPTRNTRPAFPFPEPTPFAHRFGAPDFPHQPRTRPLPPALRSSQVSILAEHLLEVTTECRAVRTIGIRELKANGWTLERREQEVALLINAQPVNKGKERALGERTRDWAPLVQREEMAKTAEQEHTSGQPPAAQKRSVFHLIPPPVDTSKTVWTPAVHPPRQPRKRSAVPRDPTVKVESLELSLTL